MARAAAGIDQRRFTVEEYHRMAGSEPRGSRAFVFRSPHEGVYRHRATYRAGDRVAPEAWADVVLELSELFPAVEPS
jgi:hypothetical protein